MRGRKGGGEAVRLKEKRKGGRGDKGLGGVSLLEIVESGLRRLATDFDRNGWVKEVRLAVTCLVWSWESWSWGKCTRLHACGEGFFL